MPALLQRRKAPRMGVRERPQFRSEAYKKFVRGFPCILAGRPGHECSGKVQFAHVRKGGDGGMGLKPSDWRGVPICECGHLWDQHQHGEAAFELKWGIDLLAEALRHWNHPKNTHRVEHERRVKEAAR